MEQSLLQKVTERLGGKATIGHEIRSDIDLANAISHGFGHRVIVCLANTGWNQKELGKLVIADRTLRHRKIKDEPLSVEESERATRLARIQVLAEETFHDKDKALRWLRKPLKKLNDKAPIEFSTTEHGAKVVETILAAIRWGAPA